jgi:FAD/FMN-containing dehydrogenase
MRRREFVGSGLALAAAWPLRGFTAVLKGVGDLPAKSLTGDDVLLRGSSIEDFAAGLRGNLLLQNHPDYERTRHIWNAAFDRKPAMIASCTGASDVKRAVDFARENQLLTAVRAGGHSFSGKSTCEGGFVIDLQQMQGVRVDPSIRRAHLEAGSLLGQLDHECAAFALATTAGTVSDTGAAGLTLGGGFGRLGRRFGLACDNVESFSLVTADGRFLRASASENPDLHWGLRGGGGNFGVVTAIEYRLHPMNPTILGGNLVWPLDQARDVLRHYRDIATDAPDVVNLAFDLHWDKGKPYVGVEACWSGDDHARGEAWLKPLRSFGKTAYDSIAPIPYVKLQSSGDSYTPNGDHYYSKNGFVAQLTDAGIDRLVELFPETPGLYTVFSDHCGAAYSKTAPEEAAFPRRDMSFVIAIFGGWKDPADSERNVEKMRLAWRELEPLTKGFYTNYADAETKLVGYRENYGANFERLVALKAKYDPMNLFRLNANVPPKI